MMGLLSRDVLRAVQLLPRRVHTNFLGGAHLAPEHDCRVYLMLAIVSRVFVVAYAILVDWVLPDHDAQGVERLNFGELPSALVAFQKWDAAHYISIAVEGYTKEHQLAFPPIFPRFLEWLGATLGASSKVHVVISITVATLVLNLVAFNGCARILALLCSRWRLHNRPNIVQMALFMFIFNPAGIFFTTVYTEATYALFSWTAFQLLLQGATLLCMVLFLFASLLRSNGILNVVVVLLTWIGNEMRLHWNISNSQLGRLLQMMLICGSIILPGVLYNLVQMQLLCGDPVQGQLHPTITSAIPFFQHVLYGPLLRPGITIVTDVHTAQFCTDSTPLHWLMPGHAYAYIQSKYWNVGLFRYWQVKQIPNFLLALPICCIAVYTLWNFDAIFESSVELVMKDSGTQDKVKGEIIPSTNKKTDEIVAGLHKSGLISPETWLRRVQNPAFPYAVHLFVVIAVGVLIANAQIATRLICSSCPVIYVGMAHIVANNDPRMARWRWWLYCYLVVYNVVGTALHCNFYPWT